MKRRNLENHTGMKQLAHPAWAIAAPAKPPTKVWDELEGIPRYQVSKFQMMAAIIPAKIT